MRVGDLVRWNTKVCIVTSVYESKCFRATADNRIVSWSTIEPEPFAKILVGHDDIRGVPQVDLEVVHED